MWTVRSMAAMALAAAGALQAQDYPGRPVRLIVASSSGSGVDIIARVVAQRMTEALGVQMVVDNRAGAGGTIGVQTVAKSPPDGYTLLMAAPSFPINSMLMKPAPYDVLRDFTPVGQATTSQYAIVLHPSLPARSVRELIALARARPGQLNFGSGGPGNSTHLAGELFKSLAQINIVHVPYKGSGPAMVDLIGGHIHMMFPNVVAILAHVNAGKVRALATSGPQRSRALPDLPTVVEAGLPGYIVTSWFGLVAPARTAPESIAKLNAALTTALRERETLEKIAAEGAEPAPGRPDEFGKLLSTEVSTWAKVIKAAGLDS